MRMIQKYEVVEIELEKIMNDPDNPNEVSEEDMKRIEHSLKKFGNLVPVVLIEQQDGKYKYADGEHRGEVYRRMGIKTIPAIVLKNKTEVERRLIRQTLNKLRGQHEETKDLEEFKFLKENDALLELKNLIDINIQDINTLIINDAEIREIAPENPDTVKTEIKQGDIFQLGRHILMCGDATKKEDRERLMQGKKADLVLTDPPYGVGYDYNEYKDIKDDRYIEFLEKWVPDILKSAPIVFITPGRRYEWYWQSKNPFDKIIWLKMNSSSAATGKSYYVSKMEPIYIYGKVKNKFDTDVLNFNIENVYVDGQGLNELHSCPKPVRLFSEIIRKQTEPNQIVVDIFGGSGTTLIACEQLQRECRMMEIDPVYCQIIINRWKQLTGKDVKKIG